MKDRIIARLAQKKAFTPAQVRYIKEMLLPNFKCDCKVCRFNLCLVLGVKQ